MVILLLIQYFLISRKLCKLLVVNTQLTVYKVFEKLGNIVSKVGSPLAQIIYPEMNRHIAKRDFDKAKKLNDKLFKGIMMLGGVLLIFVTLTYRFWLGYFIPDYDGYVITMLLYFVFMIYINATVGVHSLFLALNYIKYNIPILLSVNVVYLIVLWVSIRKTGIFGVILSLLLQAIAVVVVKVIIMKKRGYKEI